MDYVPEICVNMLIVIDNIKKGRIEMKTSLSCEGHNLYEVVNYNIHIYFLNLSIIYHVLMSCLQETLPSLNISKMDLLYYKTLVARFSEAKFLWDTYCSGLLF